MAKLSLALAVAACLAAASASPLWDYVHKEDGHYSYFDTGVRLNETGLGYTGYLLNMTSQAWLTPGDSDRYIWTHQMMVIVPDEIKDWTTAGVYATGGGNNHPGVPGPTDEDVLVTATLAVSTGAVVAALFQIPNQPIVYTADPLHESRSEDAAVAFSWWEYMVHQPDDPEWVIYFPMVKAASKAMTTLEDFIPKVAPGHSADSFFMAGASKRGWITWLTGATDGRVKAIMPIVSDIMHFEETVMHMWKSFGGWTFAFEDYWKMNITKYLTTPYVQTLANQIDPIYYKENLTMPKLVVDSTGDEFFMLDDDHYWWGQIGGPTYRLMITNAEHSMATGLIPLLTGAEAFFKSVLYNTKRPELTWSIADGSGDITATTDTKPDKVVLRFATTSDGIRRDFRLVKGNTPHDPCHGIPLHIFGNSCLNLVLWVGEDIAGAQNPDGSYTFKASQPLPPVGWRGFLLDFYYPGPANSTYRLTTQVSIIPQTFPFPPCEGEACLGWLV